jgi:hypothetical protein
MNTVEGFIGLSPLIVEIIGLIQKQKKWLEFRQIIAISSMISIPFPV